MNIKSCPTCSNPIPLAAPGGFCPTCLLREAAEPLSTGQTAPSLEEVAIAFPALEILSLIGQGGMGAVYKVRQPSLDRIVALKILSPELSRDPAFAERFAREARVLGKLNHPNIVTVYEHGESGGYYFLIMEYVDGVNLRQAMRAGRFTPEQALSIVPGICDALQAAHAQGIWHRDIKPENILLDQRGGVKIADFGIARLVGDQTKNFTLTGTGNALGSIAYMAPEQHESPGTVDHRADIYSLGVVIYEMLTGELPLGRFPAPSQRSAVSARIDEIVFQTLEKERERRQQSATEVKTDVQSAGLPMDTLLSQNGNRPGRITLWALSLILGGLVFGGAGAFMFDLGDSMRNGHSLMVGGGLMVGLGSIALILGYAGIWYSLWEMKRGLKSPTWRPLLESIAVIPILIRGWHWWGCHGPQSRRWASALMLLIGPSVALISWIAYEHHNQLRLGFSNNTVHFYVSAVIVMAVVFFWGRFFWTRILLPSDFPARIYRILAALVALITIGVAIWLIRPVHVKGPYGWPEVEQYLLLNGCAGVATMLLLFATVQREQSVGTARQHIFTVTLSLLFISVGTICIWWFVFGAKAPISRTSNSDVEAWAYTPRHMTSTEIETCLNNLINKDRSFGWVEGMTTQFSNGSLRLEGPSSQVRPLMSTIRMLDITRITQAGTRLGEIPPSHLSIFVVNAMMFHDEFDKKMLGPALYKTLQAEKITAPQLARSLRNHVWEFENIIVAGIPKEKGARSNELAATTSYQITIPCSDRKSDPLKLSFIEISKGFKKDLELVGMSPWLLEEAKLQSAEPFEIKAVDPKQSPKSVGETSAQPKAADTSRPNGHSLSGGQCSLFAIEAPEFCGSEEFGGCDVQDVVGSIANSLSMILRQNCSLQEDHVCHNVCMHNDSGFLVHEIVVQSGRTFDIANFPTEHQQTECVVELEFIDEMHQQRLGMHTEALFSGRSIHISAVIRDQKAGIDADHNAMIISKSIRSTHVFKEFVQVLLRQHRFPGAITETSALAPVHSRLLSSQRPADWFSFHHNILATSHPSEDGGQTSLQVV